MPVNRTPRADFSITRADSINVWQFPEHAVADKWYIALYFNDPVPYVVKFDGKMWRDSSSENKLVSIPMRIIAVPPPPLAKKEYKTEE
jgi:hypothetical protein